MHFQLSSEIVSWGKKGVDSISELLTCLLILFSQEEGGAYSRNLWFLFDSFRYYKETKQVQLICLSGEVSGPTLTLRRALKM